jgi:hypothetical protein
MKRHPSERPARLFLVSACLSVLLFTAGLAPGAASGIAVVSAADSSSDIPGVLLPGTVAAGRLGGAIYDVVYRLTVAPGSVIVGGLTGTPGTDFDIYLFDASATTVLSDVGLLRSATGPTSQESIFWPSPLGGTYYVDLNGASDVEGDYRLTLQAVPDTTPPTVSIALAGGRGSTSELAVPVTLNAVDDLSGVTAMAFSQNGSTWTPWEPFSPSRTWTFEPGDGSRTLWAKVRNGVGLQSTAASAAVTIDTDPPSATGVSPEPGSNVIGLRPTFTVNFDEAIDPSSWTNLGLIVQEGGGSLVPGQYRFDVAGRTGSFVPAIALQPGMTYVVTLGDVRDVAGNRVASAGSWTVRPVSQATLEAPATSVIAVSGQPTRIDLTLSGATLPAVVEVAQSTSVSGGFVPLTSAPVTTGRFSVVVTPAVNTTYRFTYAGGIGVLPAQLDVRTLLRRSVELVGRSSSATSRAKVGASVTLTAAVGPAAAGVPVSFRLYRFDPSRRAWIYAGSRGRNVDASGRASLIWVAPAAGSYYWRASVASTPDYANNTSPVYRWSITR